MKFINKIFLFILIISLGTVVYASTDTTKSGTAGSEEDPLVTKSYVDKKVQEAQNSSVNKDEIVNDVLKKLESQASSSSSNTYKTVELKSGQTLIAGAGSEIILRSGQALVYSDSVDGLSNVSTGEELLHGRKIEKNNLLIVSRDDGRGVTSTGNSWLLVKGSYNIR